MLKVEDVLDRTKWNRETKTFPPTPDARKRPRGRTIRRFVVISKLYDVVYTGMDKTSLV